MTAHAGDGWVVAAGRDSDAGYAFLFLYAGDDRTLWPRGYLIGAGALLVSDTRATLRLEPFYVKRRNRTGQGTSADAAEQ